MTHMGACINPELEIIMIGTHRGGTQSLPCAASYCLLCPLRPLTGPQLTAGLTVAELYNSVILQAATQTGVALRVIYSRALYSLWPDL